MDTLDRAQPGPDPRVAAARTMTVLAEQLRQLRDDAGLTLRELTRRTHVSDSSLSRYFGAQGLPPWEVVEVLCELGGGDRTELRKVWDAAVEARRRARWAPGTAVLPAVLAATAATSASPAAGTAAAGSPAAQPTGSEAPEVPGADDERPADPPSIEPAAGVAPAAVPASGVSASAVPESGKTPVGVTTEAGAALRRATAGSWDPASPEQAEKYGAPPAWRRVATAVGVLGLMAATGLAVHVFGAAESPAGTSARRGAQATAAPNPPGVLGATPDTPAPTASATSGGIDTVPLRPPGRPVGQPVRPTRATATGAAPTPTQRPSSNPPGGPGGQISSGSTVALTSDDPDDTTVPYVIDVENWSQQEGTQVHLWTWRDDSDYRNQLWAAEEVRPGGWRFRNAYSGLCLDRGTDGTALLQARCVDEDRQRWAFDNKGGIRSAVDQRCVEVSGRQRLLGLKLRIANCDGGWYQQWALRKRTYEP